MTDLISALRGLLDALEDVDLDPESDAAFAHDQAAAALAAWEAHGPDRIRQAVSHASFIDQHHHDRCGPLIDETVPFDERVVIEVLGVLGEEIEP